MMSHRHSLNSICVTFSSLNCGSVTPQKQWHSHLYYLSFPYQTAESDVYKEHITDVKAEETELSPRALKKMPEN